MAENSALERLDEALLALNGIDYEEGSRVDRAVLALEDARSEINERRFKPGDTLPTGEVFIGYAEDTPMWAEPAGDPHALCCSRCKQAQDLLRRLRQWDHLDGAHDGPYWKREIDAVLGKENP